MSKKKKKEVVESAIYEPEKPIRQPGLNLMAEAFERALKNASIETCKELIGNGTWQNEESVSKSMIQAA